MGTGRGSSHKDVVVGVDGSPPSAAALRFAADYARAVGADLRIVCAWEWPTWEGVPIVYGSFDPRPEAERTAEEAARACGLPPERVSTIVDPGPPAKLLVRVSEGSTLLVVGSRGRGGFTGLLLGSVSSQCVHHARCPVVVVHEDVTDVAEQERSVELASAGERVGAAAEAVPS